jgi:hypothetical protein
MRAGPLSDSTVIDLLNRYFVPVYSSDEDSSPRGHGPEQEKAAHIRIYQEALKKPFGAGAVYVFILDPQGEVIDGMDVAHANQEDALLRMLKRTIEKLHTTPGAPIIAPTNQSRPPKHPADALVLHLVARGSLKAFPWREFPGENWILLSRSEWMSLLPRDVTADSSWSLNDALTRKLLTDFYPPTEELDTTQDRNEIQTATLSAKPISRKGSILRVQLDGKLVMKHSFYANRSDNFTVNATLLGWIEFDTAKTRITDFQLTTKHATYGGGTAEDFNAALYSVPDSVLP